MAERTDSPEGQEGGRAGHTSGHSEIGGGGAGAVLERSAKLENSGNPDLPECSLLDGLEGEEEGWQWGSM